MSPLADAALSGMGAGGAMGRARRARRIAQAAAYGGGFGVAGIGALGALGYGLIKAEAVLARRAVGEVRASAPEQDGLYGAGPGRPIELVVLGDSSAAGLGTESADQSIGAILASGVSAFAGRRVRLTNVAVVGAVSADLVDQVAEVLDHPAEVGAPERPDAAVILIGANDVTHRIDKSIAVRHLQSAVARLREAGAVVVVGTCPDLGAVQPIAQPLRTLARRWSRDLAAAQTVAVVEAGGHTVSLGDLLGLEFAQSPSELFSPDRFHPSPAGYARAAAVLLPTLCSALGLLDEDLLLGFDRGRTERVTAVSRAATRAVREPGTEVAPTQVAGHARGRLGRWAVVLHRAVRPAPVRGPAETQRTPGAADTDPGHGIPSGRAGERALTPRQGGPP